MRVLMCSPKYFDVPVAYHDKNPWMDPQRRPDPSRVETQWKELIFFYRSHGIDVLKIRPKKGLFDQVFTANVAWGTGNTFIMSNLDPQERRPEIKYAAHWFVDHHFSVHFLPEYLGFEGQSDILNIGEYFLFCYGIRNSLAVKEYIERVFRLEKTIIPLRLADPRFYHGDMCIRYSRRRHAILYIPDAFDEESLSLIKKLPVKKLAVPPELWVQETKFGRNFPLNGCYINEVETFPWDERTGKFPQEIRKWIEEDGSKIWLHNFDQFGLSGAGHRCITLFID